jgi:shikimate kinase
MSGKAPACWILGFRAAGKTTMGRALSEHLGWRFLDLDEEFERLHGSILAFTSAQGLPRFREEEAEILRQAAASPEHTVFALGGGFVDHAPSREILARARGVKLWLDPPAELLWGRLEGDQKRLKIGDLSTFEGMRSLLEKRRPFYEEIATFRTESQDISECLALIQSFVVGNS